MSSLVSPSPGWVWILNSIMRRTTSKQVGKSSIGNHLLYLHMSNHYRRIYNAKCTVDTSPPQTYKSNRSGSGKRQPHVNSRLNLFSCGPSECELALVDAVSSDTKHTPHSYMDRTWTKDEVLSQARSMAVSKQHECVGMKLGCQQGRSTRRTSQKSPVNTKSWGCRRKVPAADLIDRHAKNFVSPDQAFKPRILKTEAQSRLQDMRVYHPPSRRSRPCNCVVLQQKEKQNEEEVMSGGTSARCSDLYEVQKNVSSKGSSRDSAYNGGVSSGAESRGPTPEQQSPVALCPMLPTAEKMLKEQCSTDKMMTRRANTEKVQLQKKEDAAYVKFVHDITEDVLTRGIYSDRGLQKLFQRHVKENEGNLNLDRMCEEVVLLCQQLGIPQTNSDLCRSDSGGELVSVSLVAVSEVSECRADDRNVPEKLISHKVQCGEKPTSQRKFTTGSSDKINCHSVACQTSEIFTADESVGSGSAHLLDELSNKCFEPEPILRSGSKKCTIDCQTSEIYMADEKVGSNIALISDEQISEIVDSGERQSYARTMIWRRASELLDNIDQYKVLETLGKKQFIIDKTAEIVTYVIANAIIIIDKIGVPTDA